MKYFALLFCFLILQKDILALDIDTDLIYSQKNESSNVENRLMSKQVGTFESSIDPETYRIHGGDKFVFTLIGLSSLKSVLTVDQAGNLFIPDIGVINIKNLTITEALDTVQNFIKQRLKRPYEIYLAFAQAKEVMITLAGAVPYPGSYTFQGTYRVLDAIKYANKDALLPINEYNYREVKFETEDTTIYLDIIKSIFSNDLSQNPYLSPGAKITLSKAERRIYLDAPISNGLSGYVPIKENEKAFELLNLFSYLESIDSNNITFKRNNYPDQETIKNINWNDLTSINLRDQDVIVISNKQNYYRQYFCTIEGEVNRPGNYPIIDKRTTVNDIIEISGGLTENANMAKMVILRKNSAPNQDKIPVGILENVAFVRPEISSALNKVKIMSDYSIITIDSSAASELLESADRVIIPRIENKIYLSGSINKPGAYDFLKGKKLNYYVKKAGGYTNNADKINTIVLSVYSNAVQVKDKGVLEDGDIVVVPVSQQDRFINTFLLPVIQSFTLAITAIFTVLSFSNR
ncbi:MAG: hypothetical protein GX660_12485 [Clostridiaceae bacterium]|nr:hypothetical protein [Clostridiaceae bacterium]